MEIAGIPLREVLVGLSILAAVYLGVTVLRLLRLRRPPPPRVAEPAPPLPPLETTDETADETEDEAGIAEDLVYQRPFVSTPPEAPSFDAELGRSQLEREVRQLRAEAAALRDEVAALRQELGELKAASRVSPQYADAMALAQRGSSAQDVADRCGISLAEAELVWALARGPNDYEQEDEYGGEPGRTPARPAD